MFQMGWLLSSLSDANRRSCPWWCMLKLAELNNRGRCSGGGAGEPGVPGEREQPGDVPDGVHALLAVAVGDDGDQLHGHGVPAGAPRRLPLRRLLHHLHHLHRQRLHRVHGTPSIYLSIYLSSTATMALPASSSIRRLSILDIITYATKNYKKYTVVGSGCFRIGKILKHICLVVPAVSPRWRWKEYTRQTI
jgi:hypothetical protein